MKTIKAFFAASCIAIASVAGVSNASASETAVTEKQSVAEDSTPLVAWGVNADVVSKYLWRGTALAKTPGFQPGVKATIKGFTLGAWGSYHFIDEYAETDLYASYALPFGITLTANDYFYYTPGANTLDPGYTADYFDFKNKHYIEALASIAVPKTGLTLTGGAMVYGADTTKSIYTEAAYQFSAVKVFVGAGNGMTYTLDQKFKVCNVGLSLTKSIPVTDKFSLPITGTFVVNPDRKQAHLVFMMSF